MLKPGQRQKGTYYVQCCLKETKDKDLIFPDKPEDITEELKKIGSTEYADIQARFAKDLVSRPAV